LEDALRGSAIFGEDDASDDREASWGSLSEQEPELQAPSHVLKRFSLRGSSALSRRAACSGPKRRHLSASGTDHCTGSVKILLKFRVARIAGVKLIDLRASSTRPPGKPVVIGLGRVGPPVPVTRLATELTVGAGEQPGGASTSLSASGQNRTNPPPTGAFSTRNFRT
jgi:hypothetical protein